MAWRRSETAIGMNLLRDIKANIVYSLDHVLVEIMND
jgi:hypothetical protein